MAAGNIGISTPEMDLDASRRRDEFRRQGLMGGPMENRGASAQAAALRNPQPLTATTPVNPMQDYAYSRAKDYESGLADSTNAEITRELGRARDEISVGMAREGEAAISRGADPSLFRTRALEGGKRDLHALQGRLADVALGRREGAIKTLGETAGAAAGEQRLMHMGILGTQLAAEREDREAAETQARLYEAPYDRMLRTMDAVGRNRNNFGIFGSSSSALSPTAGRSLRGGI